MGDLRLVSWASHVFSLRRLSLPGKYFLPRVFSCFLGVAFAHIYLLNISFWSLFLHTFRCINGGPCFLLDHSSANKSRPSRLGWRNARQTQLMSLVFMRKLNRILIRSKMIPFLMLLWRLTRLITTRIKSTFLLHEHHTHHLGSIPHDCKIVTNRLMFCKIYNSRELKVFQICTTHDATKTACSADLVANWHNAIARGARQHANN